MIKVSLIVPVYNVEKYLKKCLDSIVNQTLEDIEIICVDDGSTDDSPLILEEYAKKDSRIKIIHQKNMGPSYARNKGIECAKGEYLEFVDSDDWIEPETCEFLYNKAKELDVEMLLFCAKRYLENKDEYDYSHWDYNYTSLRGQFWNKVFSYKDVPDIFKVAVSPCLKLYNLEFLKNSKVYFPSNYFEDNYFFYSLFLKAKKISVIENQFYNRRVRDGSITTLAKNSYLDSIIATDQIVDAFKENNLFETYKKEVLYKKFNTNRFRFFQIDASFKEKYWELLKKDFNVYKHYFNEEKDYFNPYLLNFYNNLNKSKSCIELLEFEIKDLNKNHNNLESKFNHLKKENKDLESKFNRLKNENNDLKAFKKSVLSSNSWKMTEPLRSIRNKSNL